MMIHLPLITIIIIACDDDYVYSFISHLFPFFSASFFVCVACICLARIDVVPRHKGSNDDKICSSSLLEGHFYSLVCSSSYSWEIEAYIMIMSPPGDTGKKRHTMEDNLVGRKGNTGQYHFTDPST